MYIKEPRDICFNISKVYDIVRYCTIFMYCYVKNISHDFHIIF